MRRIRGGLLALLLALIGLVVGAGPASAHAQLESTTPTQGAQVQALPTEVSLTFGEGVTINDRSVKVLDGTGHRVDDGSVTHPGGHDESVGVGLRGGLPKGSYTVVWRVVSADSHPVSGTFTFGYGVPAGLADDNQAGASPVVTGLDGVARGTAYAGLMLLVGGAAFLWQLWPGGASLRRPRLVLRIGWVTLAASTVALLLLDGIYDNALGLSSIADTELFGETVGTRYGKLLLARLLLLGLAIPLLHRLTRAPAADAGAAPRERGQAFDLAGIGVTLLLTFTLAEHAGTGIQVPLSVVTDALHLAASCVWVGGLVLLAASLLTRGHAGELRAVLPRWSRWAMVSVAVIAATGAYQSWREVGALQAFPHTRYGVLLLVKIGAFLLLVALGDLGRRWVLRHAGTPRPVALAAASLAGASVAPAAPLELPPPTPVQVRTLRRSVGVEVAIAAVILGLTAVLVNSQPGRDAYAAPFDTTISAPGASGPPLTVTIDIDSTKRGPTTVHVYTYTSVGAIQPVSSVQLLLTDAAGDPPVRGVFTPTGEGHLTAYGVIVPTPGTWTMTLQITVGDTMGYAGAFTYSVD